MAGGGLGRSVRFETRVSDLVIQCWRQVPTEPHGFSARELLAGWAAAAETYGRCCPTLIRTGDPMPDDAASAQLVIDYLSGRFDLECATVAYLRTIGERAARRPGPQEADVE